MSNSCAVSFQAGSSHYTTPNPNNLSTQVKATHFCKHFQEQDLSCMAYTKHILMARANLKFTSV